MWLLHLKSAPSEALEHLVFVVRNVLDPECLERCLDMMVAAVNAESQGQPERLAGNGDETQGRIEEALLVSRLLTLGLPEVVLQVKQSDVQVFDEPACDSSAMCKIAA